MKLKIKSSTLLYLAAALAAIYVLVFTLPNRIEVLALIPEKFNTGEFWRLATFQFAHLDQMHLLINLAGVMFVGYLATEIKLEFDEFAVTYFLAGMLAVVPFLSTLNYTVLGASAAIYGAFGLVAMNSKKWNVRTEYILAFVVAVIFIETLIYYFTCGPGCESFSYSSKQSILHFSGLVFGIGIFLSYDKFKQKTGKKKRQILRRR